MREWWLLRNNLGTFHIFPWDYGEQMLQGLSFKWTITQELILSFRGINRLDCCSTCLIKLWFKTFESVLYMCMYMYIFILIVFWNLINFYIRILGFTTYKGVIDVQHLWNQAEYQYLHWNDSYVWHKLTGDGFSCVILIYFSFTYSLSNEDQEVRSYRYFSGVAHSLTNFRTWIEESVCETNVLSGIQILELLTLFFNRFYIAKYMI